MTMNFGDNVRILPTDQTKERGLAGLEGQVFGHTMPSVTEVEVIGEPQEDFALSVFFENRNEQLWFAPEVLEFVDHAPGTEISIDGLDRKIVRSESGEWLDVSAKSPPPKSWWKFW